MKERSIADLVFLVGLVLGIVGWATEAYSAMTGTTIFLIFMFSSWPMRIALRTKEGGWLSARGSNLLSIGFLAVWAIYLIVVQAIGGLGSTGYFIGFVVIGGVTWTVGSYHTAARSVWLRKNSNNPISTRERLTHPITIMGYVLGIASMVIIILTFNKTMGYTAGAITLSVFIYMKIYHSIMKNVNLMPE